MIQKFYFFRTVKVEGRPRLRPLMGQNDSMGNPIQENLNVQADSIMRGSYPIGTVFGSESLELRTHSSTPFYSAGAIYPMGLALGNYIVSSHMPSKEMTDAWNEFKNRPQTPEPEQATLFTNVGTPTTAGSLLAQIRNDRKYSIPTIDKDGFYIDPKDWQLLIRNIVSKVNTMMIGPSGSGKCLGKDTPVLMYDGSIKKVQDIKVGEQLMGPDSKPRNVLSVTTGREELYKITPAKGDSWVCNKSHILSLERCEKKCNPFLKRWNVPVTEYLAWSKTRKSLYKQWRTGVNFPYKKVEVDPYFLGLWLGDGKTDAPTISSADYEIAMFLEDYAKSIGCKVSAYYEKSRAISYGIVRDDARNSRTRSAIQEKMDKYNLFSNKHIPEEYLHNCRKIRLAVLAGLIDTDGNNSSGCVDYVTKSEQLKDDVIYLCRSLGLYVNCNSKYVSSRKYWRLTISGDLSEVPTLLERKQFKSKHRAKSALHTSFSIESIGEGDYYGFTIDGDHLFLLGDFTVTHNTELVMLACRKLGLECSVYDMGSMYDPVAGLLGVHRLQKGGESVFDYAKFTQDIQKPGVVLLDELSRAPVTTNNILFPCLDSRRMLPVEMAGGDNMRSIAVHPDCVFIATANVGAEYTGTMSLDRALVGRFFPLELDYMPCTEEAKVLSKRSGISSQDAANIVAVAETIRSLYSKQELSCSISTRETLMAGQLVSDGWTALEAMELVYLPLFEGTRNDGERSIVSKIFMTR